MSHRILIRVLASAGALLAAGFTADSAAQSARALDVRSAQVVEHWTPAARAAAIPRDLVIDERGLGYLRHLDGSLEPHGHDIAAMAGPPSGGGDSTPPSVGGLIPAAGATIGASADFSAVVSDSSGLKSVTANVQQSGGPVQTFTMVAQGGGIYGVNLSGFTNGSWSWWVTAKDNAKPASNTTNSAHLAFTVDTGGGPPPPPPPGGAVTSSPWTTGVAKMAIGRIYFEMPANPKKTRWTGYVCSGTVVNDGTSGRSVILTASHCVYDDANKAFARNVMFIPDQMETTGTGTDRNCANDKIGCWVASFGVVDANWTTRTFPANVAWDYAFYVVADSGAHTAGLTAASDVLDAAVAPMNISFGAVSLNTMGHALGYSYSEDPKLMYCADTLVNEPSAPSDDYWLAGCGLTGGSSGGPWSQPFNTGTGNGPIISVNSWGYTNQVGMAGPKLTGTSALCVFNAAKGGSLTGSGIAQACTGPF